MWKKSLQRKLMKNYFIPDYYFDTYKDVTPEFLTSVGIKFLLIDIDNTLAPYEVAEPDDNHRTWFSAMAEAGIRCALISNNHADRVELFNKTLGLPAYPDSHKPSGKYLKLAMAAMGADPASTTTFGDQIFTDVLAGKKAGLRAILVPPIKDKTSLFFKTKRLLEKPFLRAYRKREARRVK